MKWRIFFKLYFYYDFSGTFKNRKCKCFLRIFFKWTFKRLKWEKKSIFCNPRVRQTRQELYQSGNELLYRNTFGPQEKCMLVPESLKSLPLKLLIAKVYYLNKNWLLFTYCSEISRLHKKILNILSLKFLWVFCNAFFTLSSSLADLIPLLPSLSVIDMISTK